VSRGTLMNRVAGVGTGAATIMVVALACGSAIGEERPLAAQLVGTWTLISHIASRPDGSKVVPYGATPKGIAVFDTGGRFIISVMRDNRTKYGIDLPSKGTAEENKETAEGTMTYFGTYSVNEPKRIIAIHIEASSFPNWSGADQMRGFSIVGDELTLTARALATGGQADVIWKRRK
jgi:hypothetical protein